MSDLVVPELRDMASEAALPRQNGELVFDAPWQGRALGMAIGVTRSLGTGWDSFRQALIRAIEQDATRPYYESWLAALEDLVVEHGIVATDELARRAGIAERRYEPGVGTTEAFALPVDEATLLAIITDLFQHWWRQIRFGPIIQGAVFEGRASAPARIGLLDGYVTVEPGDWHFHLCIGEHSGTPGDGVEPAVAQHRRCHRAELYRLLYEDAPVSWGLRLFNGAGEQQITVLLPNPFLDDEGRELPEPDWSRLDCWDHLRETYLGLPPDVRDRTAPRFHHG